jgi:hypothetical protein
MALIQAYMEAHAVGAFRIVPVVLDGKTFAGPRTPAARRRGKMQQKLAAFRIAAPGKERDYGLKGGGHAPAIPAAPPARKNFLVWSLRRPPPPPQNASMALTFVNCRSCGGRTQINPRIPAAERICMLCSGPAEQAEDEEFVIPSAEPLADIPPAHIPAELEAGTCPHCFAGVVVDPGRPLKSQRCQACGEKLVKRRRKNQEKKADAPGAEATLFRRARERVWLPVAGVTFAVILASIWAIWMMNRPESKNADAPEAPVPGEEDELRAVVTAFSGARSADELLPFIREPEKFAPAVREWCAVNAARLPLTGQFLRVESAREALGHRIRQVSVQLPDQSVVLWMLTCKERAWRVDWRAFTGVADKNAEEFLAQKPAAPCLVLAVVQLSDYYNGAYANSQDWQCPYVIDPKGAHFFHAYVPRPDAAMMEKLKILPPSLRDGRNLPATSRRLALRMVFKTPEAAALGQAEVTAIEGNGWFIP